MLNAASPDPHGKGGADKSGKKRARRVSFRSSAVSAVGVTGGDTNEYVEEVERVDRDEIPVSTTARTNHVVEVEVVATKVKETLAQGQGLGQGLGTAQGPGLASTPIIESIPTKTLTKSPSPNKGPLVVENENRQGVGSSNDHPQSSSEQSTTTSSSLPLSEPLSQPLPAGVTAHLDAESGKYFYSDQSDNKTSWTIPGTESTISTIYVFNWLPLSP